MTSFRRQIMLKSCPVWSHLGVWFNLRFPKTLPDLFSWNLPAPRRHLPPAGLRVAVSAAHPQNYLMSLCWSRLSCIIIDMYVLLKNIPLVKSIRIWSDIWDRSGVFSLFSLVRILMTSFRATACTAAKLCQTPAEKWRAIGKLNSLTPT